MFPKKFLEICGVLGLILAIPSCCNLLNFNPIITWIVFGVMLIIAVIAFFYKKNSDKRTHDKNNTVPATNSKKLKKKSHKNFWFLRFLWKISKSYKGYKILTKNIYYDVLSKTDYKFKVKLAGISKKKGLKNVEFKFVWEQTDGIIFSSEQDNKASIIREENPYHVVCVESPRPYEMNCPFIVSLNMDNLKSSENNFRTMHFFPLILI